MIAQSVSQTDLDAAYPWDGLQLRANMIVTLDGAVTGDDGVSGSIGTATDRAIFSLLRRTSDLVLVGAGTYRAEQYKPITSGPTLCLVSRRLDLDPTSDVFTRSPHRPIVITCASADQERRSRLSDVATLIFAGDDHVDLTLGVSELSRMGFARILCEGGPHLLTELLAAGLVDELCLSISAIVSGSPQARSLVGDLPAALKWRVVQALFDQDGVYSRLQPAT